jgi:hypothetical protein
LELEKERLEKEKLGKEKLDNEREEENEKSEKLEKKLEGLKAEKEMLERLLRNRVRSRWSEEILPKIYQVDLEKSEWFTRGWQGWQ